MAVINTIQESHLRDVSVIGENSHPPSISHTVKRKVSEEEFIDRSVDRQAMETCTVKTKPKVDFSIEAILSSRTSTSSTIVVSSTSDVFTADTKTIPVTNCDDPQFSWVYCTRYRPPKLPRVKREVSLRNRYRNPRIPFSTTEVNALEKKFIQSPYLGSNDVNELAANLNMSPKRVKIWFQNRRARERREREVQ